ncbi:MAG TPA: hypothetical protein VL981_04960 [Candidatus Methylacidiphilales bacterium]|nr:hypothetical protein [Candidatus Methylacidiphilales bacterium]
MASASAGLGRCERSKSIMPGFTWDKPKLARRMWRLCVARIIVPLQLPLPCLMLATIGLRSDQRSDHLFPAIRRKIEAEQNPCRLHRQAYVWLDAAIESAEIQEAGFRFMAAMSVLWEVALMSCGVATGVFACQLQRQHRLESPQS